MKKTIATLLIALSIAVPVFAQDVTPEPVEPTPVETVAPTAAPTEVPAPAPVNVEAIPAWVGTMLIVLVLGIVSVSVVGIVQAAKGLPSWARDILLAVADRGLVSLDEYAKTTPNEIDNAAVAELRKEFEQFKLELADIVAQKPVG